MATSGCRHVTQFKAEGGLKTLDVVRRYVEQAGLGKVAPPRCSTCGTFSGRLFACLRCVHFSCAQHLRAHQQPKHTLAIELAVLHVFCAECNDFSYDAEWESLVRAAKRRKPAAPAQQGGGPVVGESSGNDDDDEEDAEEDEQLEKPLLSPMQLLGSPMPMSGEALQEELFKAYATAVAPHQVRVPVRGLRNLGNTCFMNAILQCMAHNPLLRNWLLSDMHWRCPVRSQREANVRAAQQQASAQQPTLPVCLACELQGLVGEIFDGDVVPVAPHRFLYAMWRICGSFASYDQHDSHELLITVLNAVHAEVTSTPSAPTATVPPAQPLSHTQQQQPAPTSTATGPCQCIVHRSFGGMLRSDVTCTRCGKQSTTLDPFIDISLDVPKHQDAAPPGNGKVATTAAAADVELCTLAACLERYTRPETLSQSERYACDQCNDRCDSMKQLSFAKLPNVVCFHLKRFEHTQTRRMFGKIETRVDFPCTIDLSRFTPSSLASKAPGRTSPTPQSATAANYELFGVVNHFGRIDTGHYTSYVRSGKLWFFCDDAHVSRVPVSQVLKSQAYLLFYVRRKLEFEPGPLFSLPPGLLIPAPVKLEQI